jgi:Predicted S-adenosylmethionine-dependent methyltransferase
MSMNKLERFAENETFSNLFQCTSYKLDEAPFPLKGCWREEYFKNDNPLVLELGCGRGEYTLALAQQFPHVNFIGIDRKGARLWRGCKTALELPLPNVAFLRISIDTITSYFGKDEVDEIWVTFPDPQPSKPRKRLTSPEFIERYRPFLKSNGVIQLKTDSPIMYEFTLESIKNQPWTLLENIEDVYLAAPDIDEQKRTLLTEIQTYYEKIWLKEGKAISYLKFRV